MHTAAALRSRPGGVNQLWKRKRSRGLQCQDSKGLIIVYDLKLVCIPEESVSDGEKLNHSAAIHVLTQLWQSLCVFLLRRSRVLPKVDRYRFVFGGHGCATGGHRRDWVGKCFLENLEEKERLHRVSRVILVRGLPWGSPWISKVFRRKTILEFQA